MNRLPLDKIEAISRWRPNDWRDGPQFGPGLSSARAQELRGSFRSDLERRDGAASQHGDDCRQSVATDALHVFPRHRDAVQQARAGLAVVRAITGVNRSLAILGTSEHCIATNPSDMNVAMAALEATIHVRGTKGERSIPIGDFHLVCLATRRNARPFWSRAI